MKKQHGFSIIEVVIVVAVIAVIGLIGYNVVSRTPTATKDGQEAVGTSQQATVPAAPEVSSTADLNNASSALDQIDPDQNEASLSDVDAELSNF